MLKQTYHSNLQLTKEETVVDQLGVCKYTNPIIDKFNGFELSGKGVLINPFVSTDGAENKLVAGNDLVSFEIAGPAPKLFFSPKKTVAAIVTCGGICPGLNNVIRAIVLALNYGYGCQKIYGFRYGLQGFIPKYGHDVMELDYETVTDIHNAGGTILGTSRGPQSVEKVVDKLQELKINQLYFIGGDGSLCAAAAIVKEVKKRKLTIGVVGIPKTIDNDIPFASETFGFDTAVDIATKAIKSAHVEAKSHYNGVGLVKLMGRNSGFIAALSSLSQRDVNFVLIPEKKFELNGEKGFLNALEQRLQQRQHAVIVVAEGAGQDMLKKTTDNKDPSGNLRFGDIGLFLKKQIGDHFKARKITINLKYIDPSYMIRSVHSNTHDNLFAATLGANSVHALMSGKTNLMISIWHGVYCYVPLNLVTSRIKRLSLTGRIWLSVLESTGQKDFINS